MKTENISETVFRENFYKSIRKFLNFLKKSPITGRLSENVKKTVFIQIAKLYFFEKNFGKSSGLVILTFKMS